MKSRPLIVAQAPSSRSDPSEPLSGASGRRLAALCGLELDAFLARFERVNLLGHFPGKAAKGDRWDARWARTFAYTVAPQLCRRRTVLLGWNVARAFDMHELEWFEWKKLIVFGAPAQLAVAPHPSGISRWWNEPMNVRQARRFWRRLATQ